VLRKPGRDIGEQFTPSADSYRPCRRDRHRPTSAIRAGTVLMALFAVPSAADEVEKILVYRACLDSFSE
jgi:hypothetical protein